MRTESRTATESNVPVDAVEGGITMDLACEPAAGSAGGAAAGGTHGAAKEPPLCKLTVLDLKQYYETHDPSKATDENKTGEFQRS